MLTFLSAGPTLLPMACEMETSIEISEELLRDVKELSKSRTNKEAVTTALEEYLRIRRSAALTEILGTFSDFMDRNELERSRTEQ